MRALTDTALLTLLERAPEKLERHLEKHPNDVERLELLTEMPAEQRRAVENEVAAPADIATRMAARLKVDSSLRDAGEAFANLLTIGFQTARVIFETPAKDDRIGE